MLAVEPTAIHSTVPLTTQILEWVNGFTLPAIIATVWGATRWLTKKEDEFRAGLEAAKAELETIKTNHLHHIQESLNEIKNAQVETTKEMASQTKEMVQATNQSKDAIVNAIISMK